MPQKQKHIDLMNDVLIGRIVFLLDSKEEYQEYGKSRIAVIRR